MMDMALAVFFISLVPFGVGWFSAGCYQRFAARRKSTPEEGQ
jgi:hypothetical protein